MENASNVLMQMVMRNLALYLTFLTIMLSACSTTESVKKNQQETNFREVIIKENLTDKEHPKRKPDFVPVSEELSPLKTRIVSVSARSTPLKDVLYVIAEATGLNLVMEKGVEPEIPVNLTLKNVSAEDALRTIFSSVDYFYSIKDNMLIVKAMDTKFFEFAQPSIIQDYTVEVGGDILGGGTSGTGAGAETVATSIKGNVTQKIQSDKDSFKLWDIVEKNISIMLGLTAEDTRTPNAGVSQLRPHFSINRMTGTIMVTAGKKDIERVENYLAELKKILNRQVIIEARIVEVQLSEGLKYGIDWTAIVDVNNLGEVTFETSRFTETVGDLPHFKIGIVRRDFTGLLKALQTQGEVRVLSNPRINIMNGQTALLSAGRNVSFISRVETTTTSTTGTVPTTTFTVQTSSVLSGIIIGIVPKINEHGEISLTITPIVSDLVSLIDRTIGRVGENTIQISLPTIDLRALSTTVKVKDNEMVVIGGLIQNRETLKDSQVPFLGKVPVLGYLFKGRDNINEKTELVIMLKPKILVI